MPTAFPHIAQKISGVFKEIWTSPVIGKWSRLTPNLWTNGRGESTAAVEQINSLFAAGLLNLLLEVMMLNRKNARAKMSGGQKNVPFSFKRLSLISVSSLPLALQLGRLQKHHTLVNSSQGAFFLLPEEKDKTFSPDSAVIHAVIHTLYWGDQLTLRHGVLKKESPSRWSQCLSHRPHNTFSEVRH